MNKLSAFVRLDVVTIKPYLTAKNLLTYLAIALFIAISSGSATAVATVGMMFGMMFSTYPFSLGEKSGLDALYAVLSLNRRAVVLGRYLFALVLDVCIVLLMNVLALVCVPIGGLLAQSATYGVTAGELMWMSMGIAAVLLVIQAVQLPIYFRHGYSKGRFLSMIPFMVLMTASLAVSSLLEEGARERVAQLVSSLSNGWLVAGAALALGLMTYISYRLSLAAYAKREF